MLTARPGFKRPRHWNLRIHHATSFSVRLLLVEVSNRVVAESGASFQCTKKEAAIFSDHSLFRLRKTGLEPAWVAPHAPQACASANFATCARQSKRTTQSPEKLRQMRNLSPSGRKFVSAAEGYQSDPGRFKRTQHRRTLPEKFNSSACRTIDTFLKVWFMSVWQFVVCCEVRTIEICLKTADCPRICGGKVKLRDAGILGEVPLKDRDVV